MVPRGSGMFMYDSWRDYINDVAISHLEITPDGTIHIEFEQEDYSSGVDDDEFMKVLEECG